jgi:hypothetical protein
MARNETHYAPASSDRPPRRTHGIVDAPDPDDQQRAVLEHIADIEEFVGTARMGA